MLPLQYLAITIATLALLFACRLSWASYRLSAHPHVEPIESAHPGIAFELNQLIADIASIACIPAPALYIQRSALPNAFVVATISRPDLFLTDELLEECDSLADGVDRLTWVICHEIAHIQRADALRVGLLISINQALLFLHLEKSAHYFQLKIQQIENETDIIAETLLTKLNNPNSPTV
ncbi:MAG: M48 family metalloprotease [Mariprofundus sp.]|nr:M48 family metalloprotease [Mariprofundus sp.]